MKYNAAQAARTMAMLSHPTRLLILCHLHEGECSVTELMGLLGVSQTALSQHLAKLRRHDLVHTRRDAQTIYYSLHGNEARVLLGALHQLYCAPKGVDGEAELPAMVETDR